MDRIFTLPAITTPSPSSDDNPYAGWLYGSLGILSDTDKTLDNVILSLGVVGPASGAEQTQKFIHHVSKGSPQPMGWDHQLKNEPGANLAYERKWRNFFEAKPFGASMDVMPHVGVNLGNIHTDASTGLTLRFGNDLPADYGPPLIRSTLSGSDFFMPTKTLGGYLFVTGEGRVVARNIFLDGNSFRSGGPSVQKEILVGSMQLGAVVTYKSLRFSYTHVFVTREFKAQKESIARYGAVTVSWRF